MSCCLLQVVLCPNSLLPLVGDFDCGTIARMIAMIHFISLQLCIMIMETSSRL